MVPTSCPRPSARLTLAALLALAAISGGCDRSSPPPLAPEPVSARGPGPEPAPTAEPPPPPKEAPTNQAPDAPASPAAAAPSVEDKPAQLADEKPTLPVPSDQAAAPANEPVAAPGAPTAAAKVRGKVREIHPSEPGKGCVEMYGDCTPPPDEVCTSSAFYLDCGKRGKVPKTGEAVRCVCP